MNIGKKLTTAELLYKRAQTMGLNPAWITPSGVFAISVDGREQFVNVACSPLNSHTSVSLIKNKYITRLILARNKLKNIPFARPKTFQEAADFLREHGTIIVKPLRGVGSRDVHIVSDLEQLQKLPSKGYIFEKYIVGREMRYLVLGGKVIGVHRSEYGTSVAEDRKLERISYPESSWDVEQTALSLKIARLFNLNFAAVDYLVEPNGNVHILEVNAAPGLKWFHAPTSGPIVDVASLFLQAMTKDHNLTHSYTTTPTKRYWVHDHYKHIFRRNKESYEASNRTHA